MIQKNIIVRLAGGLGNQIFQLGAALLLARRNHAKKIILDGCALRQYSSARSNNLSSFFDLKKFFADIITDHLFLTKCRLGRLLSLNLSNWPFVSDRNFQTSLIFPNKSFIALDGYFQTCLVQNIFDEMLDILSDMYIHDRHSTTNRSTCIVHIRGGDFISLGRTDISPENFYQDAIHKMVHEHAIRKFKIITDDVSYAQKIMHKCHYYNTISSRDIVSDFKEISNYPMRILSSSTFCFWASALGNNHNGTVYAPPFWLPGKQRRIRLPNETAI
jgi:hypothetical protein